MAEAWETGRGPVEVCGTPHRTLKCTILTEFRRFHWTHKLQRLASCGLLIAVSKIDDSNVKIQSNLDNVTLVNRTP
jgi:hypothetical protein